MKTKFIALLMAVLLLIACFTGCGNRQLIDTTYTFDYVQIAMPDGTVVEGECESWIDYENSDSVQIVVNGVPYYTHISNVVLVGELPETD